MIRHHSIAERVLYFCEWYVLLYPNLVPFLLLVLSSAHIIRRHRDLFCLPASVHVLELFGWYGVGGGFLQTIFMPVLKGAFLIVAGFCRQS